MGIFKGIFSNEYREKTLTREKNEHADLFTVEKHKKEDIIRLIKQIHNDFQTEVDKLLEASKIQHSTESIKLDLIKKRERLLKFGFKNTPEIEEANNEIERMNEIELKNKKNIQLFKAINHFSKKYPNYKFITEDSVRVLCNKYNLVIGDVGDYILSIPDKNLQHIEDFKIDKEYDVCFYSKKVKDEFFTTFNEYGKYISGDKGLPITENDFRESKWFKEGYSFYCNKRWDCISVKLVRNYYKKIKSNNNNQFDNSLMAKVHKDYSDYSLMQKAMLEIVAPVSHFVTENRIVIDNELLKCDEQKIVITKTPFPDPIVLKPVWFENNSYYLVVTAWGDEAEDDLVKV